jgi:hypothetical protein
MVKQTKEELGVVTAILHRASRRRIPRLMRIKKAVDNGSRLNSFQVSFLKRVNRDYQNALPYVGEHKELQDVAIKMVELYHDITEQALKNEEAALKKKLPRLDLPS